MIDRSTVLANGETIRFQGSTYKIGRFGFAYYRHEGEWIRSTKTANDLINEKIRRLEDEERRRQKEEGLR